MDNDLQKLRIDKNLKARRDKKSQLPLVLLLLLLLGGGTAAVLGRTAIFGGGVPEVEVLRVIKPAGAVSESEAVLLSATGYIIAASKIEVAGKVVGRVAWVGVERGDVVKKDQVLVRLEDEEYQARVLQQEGILESAKAKLAELEAGARMEELGQSQAQYDQAKVDYENAELTVKRLIELEPTRSVSRQEIDDAKSDVRSKRARMESFRQAFELVKAGPRKEQIDAQRALVKQAEGGLRLAKVDLANTVIKSPLNATILERNVEVGEFVTTGFVGDRGAKGYVVSVADLNELRVELDISQGDFAKTKMDQPCWVTTDAYPDRKYDGAVDLISPEANRQKATVGVRVKVLKPDAYLRPDMNATVSFLNPDKLATAGAVSATSTPANTPPPSIKIPSSAVVDNAVFVVENGKATRKSVTLGQTSGPNVEVRRGLSGGEDLIVSNLARIQDGAVVKVK